MADRRRRGQRHPAVRWAAIGMAALLVVGLVASVAASIGSGGSNDSSSATTVAGADGPDSTGTVPRDGDPEFCAAIFDFQDAYRVIVTPDASATPAEVEAAWDTFSASAGQLTDTAADGMGGAVEPVVGAFDRLRQDADAAGYDYDSIDDLPSAATIDPTGQIAQAAYAIFTYGSSRCPEAAAGAGAGAATTTTEAGPAPPAAG